MQEHKCLKTRFEWDPAKAASNFRKLGVSFQTAARVFADPYAHVERDRIENGEERWLTRGVVERVLMLTAAHTVREQDRYRRNSHDIGETCQPQGKRRRERN